VFAKFKGPQFRFSPNYKGLRDQASAYAAVTIVQYVNDVLDHDMSFASHPAFSGTSLRERILALGNPDIGTRQQDMPSQLADLARVSGVQLPEGTLLHVISLIDKALYEKRGILDPAIAEEYEALRKDLSKGFGVAEQSRTLGKLDWENLFAIEPVPTNISSIQRHLQAFPSIVNGGVPEHIGQIQAVALQLSNQFGDGLFVLPGQLTDTAAPVIQTLDALLEAVRIQPPVQQYWVVGPGANELIERVLKSEDQSLRRSFIDTLANVNLLVLTRYPGENVLPERLRSSMPERNIHELTLTGKPELLKRQIERAGFYGDNILLWYFLDPVLIRKDFKLALSPIQKRQFDIQMRSSLESVISSYLTALHEVRTAA